MSSALSSLLLVPVGLAPPDGISQHGITIRVSGSVASATTLIKGALCQAVHQFRSICLGAGAIGIHIFVIDVRLDAAIGDPSVHHFVEEELAGV